MANSGEYKSRVGLDSLYVAEVTQDDTSAYTAGTPAYLAPAAEASQEPSSSFAIQYADDQPFDVATAEGETKIALKVTGIDLATLALITGRKFDSTTGRMYDNGGTAPYMALSFRSKKSNGSYRYYQYLKGKFDMPKEDTATLAEKPEPKVLELSYTAIRTVKTFDLGGGVTDSVKRIVGDTDTTNFSATNFFAQVQTPDVAAVSALALSSSDPADGASGVAITKTITLTFNNALPAGAIKNVAVVKADGTIVACTNSLDATAKIMTVNPDASLDAASTYIVAIAVVDIYGQALNAAVNFGTA